MRQMFRLLREETASCKDDVYLFPEQFVELAAVLTVFAHVPSRNGFCRSWLY